MSAQAMPWHDWPRALCDTVPLHVGKWYRGYLEQMDYAIDDGDFEEAGRLSVLLARKIDNGEEQ